MFLTEWRFVDWLIEQCHLNAGGVSTSVAIAKYSGVLPYSSQHVNSFTAVTRDTERTLHFTDGLTAEAGVPSFSRHVALRSVRPILANPGTVFVALSACRTGQCQTYLGKSWDCVRGAVGMSHWAVSDLSWQILGLCSWRCQHVALGSVRPILANPGTVFVALSACRTGQCQTYPGKSWDCVRGAVGMSHWAVSDLSWQILGLAS